MKRYGNLYDKVISPDNLRLADTIARKGKVDTHGVRLHDRNREANIVALYEALLTQTYHTSPYQTFTIYEPKERLISRLPYYPDRIVHHAIMNVVEPIWLSVYTHNTFSCIKGRGIEGCARAVDRIIAKYKGRSLYCLKIDIRKYYPSIDHDVLKRIVRKKIKDQKLLWLIDEIIDSSEGLPIGNHTSGFLANLYLAYFMHYINERIKYELGIDVEKVRLDAVEYADDIPFFSDSKAVLHKVLEIVTRYFAEELHLVIKPNYQIFPIAKNRKDKHGRALDYVGYKFYREQKLLRKGVKKNLCRAVAKLRKFNPTIGYKEFKIAISAWIGWVKHSNSKHILKLITNSLNKEYYGILRHETLEIRGSRQRQLCLSLEHSGSGSPCTAGRRTAYPVAV